jgi:succinoglycan biosynthesis transport protein ExoP
VTHAERGGMELRDYVSVMRRRKWIILFGTIVVAATAFAVSSLQTPVYQGEAKVLLEPPASLFSTVQAQVGASQVRTEIQVLLSAPVADLVKERVGIAPGVRAQQVGDTQVIVVRAESVKPKAAAQIADAYAQAYIDYRRAQALDSLVQAGSAIQARLDEIDRKIAEYDAANPPPPVPANQLPPRAPERAALDSQRFFFQQRAEQLSVDAQLKNGGSQLVAPAAIPVEPIRPKPQRDVSLGIAVGLIFAIATAFVFEHLDDSINQTEDVERLDRELSVIGVIPAIGGWKNRNEAKLVSRAEPSSPAAEAYRALRTSIQFLRVDRSLRTLQLTSPNASEGKTTTISNLAVTLAQAGLSVILLSCDLRRPRVHEFFGLSNSLGFTSVLLGEAPLENALLSVPGVERLQILVSGPLPPNPSELLASNRASEVLNELKARADIVLIDSPPALPVTDAAVLASKVDGTILIATAGTTSRRGFGRTLELLKQVDASIVGAVLNGASIEGSYSYAYYYRQDEPTNGKVGRRGSKASVQPS